ncbi:packaged DNA stabilization gp4 family protein [Deltaproteobacteria bacterium]|nr:packaged DNA stabilization gp4 family protein [Deltaproteobacteria bacterium]
MWTKRQLIEQAFDELGLADYVFQLGPQPLESAMRKMDAMMGAWNAKGVRLGYPIPTSPDNSDLDDSSGLPDSANEAVFLNLAIRLAPSYGKVVSVATRQFAKLSLDGLMGLSGVPAQLQPRQGTVAGAGHWNNRRGRLTNPFLSPPNDPLLAGNDGEIVLE